MFGGWIQLPSHFSRFVLEGGGEGGREWEGKEGGEREGGEGRGEGGRGEGGRGEGGRGEGGRDGEVGGRMGG